MGGIGNASDMQEKSKTVSNDYNLNPRKAKP